MGHHVAPGITSPVKMVANIFVSFIGAGMLGLPFAYKESGIMEGAIIMALVGYLSVSAMLMLVDCKYAILSSGGRAGGRSIIMETKVPLIPPDSTDDEDDDERHPPIPSTDLTYGDVGLYALGPGGKRLVDIAIVVSQLGFCCGYLIYLCKNLNTYVSGVSQQLWLLFLLPPLYFLTLLRHLNKLAIFSLFAQFSNVLALTVVFWFDFSHSEEVPFTPKEFSIKGFPFFFAVAIYCYEGAGMILSLEESMAEHMRDKFRSIFVCTMGGLTTLYICFGVSGYASFGPHTMDIITLNLPHGQGSIIDFAAVVKICLGVSLFFTYPMMLFPVTHLLDKSLGFTSAPHRGNVVRLVLVAMTGMVVSAVPNFAVLMSLIGATCCTLLAFILPAAFHLSIFRQRLTRRQRYFDLLLITLGVLGSVVGLWDAFDRMSQAHDPLLALDEFSSHKNASAHHQTPPPHLPPPHVTGPILANISQAVKKYGSEGQSGQGPGKAVNASAHLTTTPPPQGAKLRAEVPSAIAAQSISGKVVPVGRPSSLAGAAPPSAALPGAALPSAALPGAALPGVVPSNGDVSGGASLSKVVTQTESPESAALSDTVPGSVSSSSSAAKGVPPSGPASSVDHSADIAAPKVAAASRLAPVTTRAPPT
ncbi:amino acid transporter ANT1-like [Portunus trituberculatus]|uniref:amino acid transporter ANT1-like n=1 Tax=Portunus trituberculatus TaxID=210409 RepID=UPI001E1CD041|nr:amino acid transporter ANT1-like [Portunus trituberculatus]